MNEDMFAPLAEAELASILVDALVDGVQPTPIVPVPDDAPPVDFEHPTFGKPDKVWTYRDAERRVVTHVCRWNLADDGKEIRPVTFCDLGDGTRGWRRHGLPAPRPLFNLPEIFERAEAPVIITEGEKSSEAAGLLFPGYVATTTMNGAKSPRKSDFTPLAGRTVVIATDFDDAGRSYGQHVHGLLLRAGAGEILHLRPEDIAGWTIRDGKPVERSGEIPVGWDLADAVEEGWTPETIRDHVTAQDLIKPFVLVAEPHSGEEKHGFRSGPRGVEYRAKTEDGFAWAFLCSPLEVIARTRTLEGEDWGLLLRFTDPDGKTKEWVMPGTMLADEGAECRRQLLSKGVEIAPGRGAQAALQAYLSVQRPTARVTTVERTGWHGDAFVMPDRTIAGPGASERIIFPRGAAEAHPYHAAGSLEGWKDSVAKLAAGNSRLAFAISAALVGPLLAPTGSESGGFHFWGPSSIGKTTALRLASSVWGGEHFPATWRSTSNGLEGIAAARSDTLLILDEIGQCSPREVGDVVYMLGNGLGKQRANRQGDPRPPKRFRNCFISSGEVSVADKIREDGRLRHTTGGQEVRVVDLPADVGRGRGLFEELHGRPSADLLARELKQACEQDYGHAGTVFVERLIADRDRVLRFIAKIQKTFIAIHKDADGQVLRVAVRFGLAAAAGELAPTWGILPWPKGEAVRAAAVCFKAWIEARGGTEPHEDRTNVERVRHFLEQHGLSRFVHLNIKSDGSEDNWIPAIRDRAGYRVTDLEKDDVYCISPEVWRKDVCKGLDPIRVAETLDRQGMLNRGSGRLQKQRRVPGVKNGQRFYEINSTIFEHGDDGELDGNRGDAAAGPPVDRNSPGDYADIFSHGMLDRWKDTDDPFDRIRKTDFK